MAKTKFSPERLWNCKYFGTRLCPHRRNEVLSELENLVGEGYSKTHTPEVFKKGDKVCAECKSFEPSEKEVS
jgi:hypothetical protein